MMKNCDKYILDLKVIELNEGRVIHSNCLTITAQKVKKYIFYNRNILLA